MYKIETIKYYISNPAVKRKIGVSYEIEALSWVGGDLFSIDRRAQAAADGSPAFDIMKIENSRIDTPQDF